MPTPKPASTRAATFSAPPAVPTSVHGAPVASIAPANASYSAGFAARGHAIVLATHDVELVADAASRTLVLAEGEIVADGPTADVVVASPTFAPQVSKILGPGPWLTVSQVAAALAAVS